MSDLVLEGVVDMYFGERLGDHLVAHSSPDDQAGIVMRPELDAIHG
jgi:uncharacterized RmlC-like cupin family protein